MGLFRGIFVLFFLLFFCVQGQAAKVILARPLVQGVSSEPVKSLSERKFLETVDAALFAKPQGLSTKNAVFVIETVAQRLERSDNSSPFFESPDSGYFEPPRLSEALRKKWDFEEIETYKALTKKWEGKNSARGKILLKNGPVLLLLFKILTVVRSKSELDPQWGEVLPFVMEAIQKEVHWMDYRINRLSTTDAEAADQFSALLITSIFSKKSESQARFISESLQKLDGIPQFEQRGIYYFSDKVDLFNRENVLPYSKWAFRIFIVSYIIDIVLSAYQGTSAYTLSYSLGVLHDLSGIAYGMSLTLRLSLWLTQWASISINKFISLLTKPVSAPRNKFRSFEKEFNKISICNDLLKRVG